MSRLIQGHASKYSLTIRCTSFGLKKSMVILLKATNNQIPNCSCRRNVMECKLNICWLVLLSKWIHFYITNESMNTTNEHKGFHRHGHLYCLFTLISTPLCTWPCMCARGVRKIKKLYLHITGLYLIELASSKYHHVYSLEWWQSN
jgi:hypothetical protein